MGLSFQQPSHHCRGWHRLGWKCWVFYYCLLIYFFSTYWNTWVTSFSLFLITIFSYPRVIISSTFCLLSFANNLCSSISKVIFLALANLVFNDLCLWVVMFLVNTIDFFNTLLDSIVDVNCFYMNQEGILPYYTATILLLFYVNSLMFSSKGLQSWSRVWRKRDVYVKGTPTLKLVIYCEIPTYS